ncbi:kinesin light chain [Cladorrhinum sp. PSN259]|nr:kinesin light chain [Cladorrhinum sp. PSN259]
MNLFTLGGSELRSHRYAAMLRCCDVLACWHEVVNFAKPGREMLNQGFQVGQNYGSINTEFHLPPERPETPPKPFAAIPFSRDPDFVDRGDILDQVDRRCSEPASCVALVGLGGVGKSQLVIEFAYRIAAGQPDTWVFWVHAGTQARLVYSWLSNERSGRWVMILDSADDRDVFYNANSAHGPTSGDKFDRRPLTTYLPQSRNGLIIIITRDKDLAFRLIRRRQNMIEVGPIVSPEKYLAEFRENERKRARLLGYDGGDLRRDGGASNAILTTWQISFDHIRSKRRTAADLLSLMSFFDRQAGDGESDDSGDTTDDDKDDVADDALDVMFEDDVAMLRDYCLIVADEAGDEFEMYGLVQLSTRRWLEVIGEQETFKQQYIERIVTLFLIGEYENWARCRSLFAHQMVGKARGVRKKKLGEEDAATLDSISLFALGRWEEAEKLEVQVMEISKTKLGADYPDTLTSMANLALTYMNQGRADYPFTLSSIGNLASTYRKQGRWEEAEKLFVQVMETRKTKLRADYPDTLTSMANIASIFWNQGRWEEAEKLFMQVMETRKTKLGADYLDTLLSMGNLASIFWNQGRWEEAEKLEVQVMETRKTKLGADHLDTLTSMANLAFTWKSQGRHSDALALIEECTQARQRLLGAEHPDTLSSLAAAAEWSS